MRAKVSTRKADFFPLGTSRVTPRARTPASSRREPEGILLKAAVDSSPPTPLMSGGHSWKASVPDGAYAAVFFGDAPVSKAVLVTDTKDDAPPGMKALYVGLSAAGAGASGVEAVVRGEGGTPVRLTSWAKSSNVPVRRDPRGGRGSSMVVRFHAVVAWQQRPLHSFSCGACCR